MAATGVTVGPGGVGDVPGDAFAVPIALAYDGGVAAAGAYEALDEGGEMVRVRFLDFLNTL